MTSRKGDKPPKDNSHLAEPKHLKEDDPGPCPAPDGCTCVWTPLSLGWTRGPRDNCPVIH